jgi:hypothetical protein
MCYRMMRLWHIVKQQEKVIVLQKDQCLKDLTHKRKPPILIEIQSMKFMEIRKFVF